MKIRNFLPIVSVLFLASCGVFTDKDKKCLTDNDIASYIKAYKNMKEKAPSMLEQVNKDKDADVKGKEGFATFEGAIKDGGIADYPTFVKMNAKIGAIFSVMQANSFMEDMGTMTEDGMKTMDNSVKTFDSLINDPNTPEDAKAEYRKAKEETQQGKKDVGENWEKNKKWADLVMEKVNKITGIIVDQCDIDMVKKHEKEIMEAYTGITPPVAEK